MCGRFYLTATPAELKKMFKVDYLPELVPRYNIAPALTGQVTAEDTVLTQGSGFTGER